MRLIAALIMVIGFLIANSATAAIPPRGRPAGPKEGLMLESQVTHLGAFVKSRVVVEPGNANWVKIGEGQAKGQSERFVIEARATMLDAEIAEVETRIRSQKAEESGKLLVRLGDYGMITNTQMETVSGSKMARAAETKLGVRVVKIRLQ